jgi:hypothetical protein
VTQQTHASHHLVRAPGEQPQHAPRVALVSRLAEDLSGDDHNGIGSQHGPAVSTRQHRAGLCLGKTPYMAFGGLVWKH